MQITPVGAGQIGFGANRNPALAQAAAVVYATGPQTLAAQLAAFGTLNAAWTQQGLPTGDRDLVVRSVTDSPFAQRVRTALDNFSRAAWAGDGARQSERQAKMLQAFDGLSPDDQEIVFTLQGRANGRPVFGGAEEFRASLRAQIGISQRLEDAELQGTDPADPTVVAAAQLAQVRGPRDAAWTARAEALLSRTSRGQDSITLSPEARALLAGGEPPKPVGEPPEIFGPPRPEQAAMIAAARAYGARR